MVNFSERGGHEELLHANGVYADMWNQQLQNLEMENNGSSSSSVSDEKTKTNEETNVAPAMYHHH